MTQTPTLRLYRRTMALASHISQIHKTKCEICDKYVANILQHMDECHPSRFLNQTFSAGTLNILNLQ